VRHDFPASTCEDYVRELHLPSARFTVLWIGSPVTFTYRAAGVARFAVPGGGPGASKRQPDHGPDDSYRWFGNCSVAPS